MFSSLLSFLLLFFVNYYHRGSLFFFFNIIMYHYYYHINCCFYFFTFAIYDCYYYHFLSWVVTNNILVVSISCSSNFGGINNCPNESLGGIFLVTFMFHFVSTHTNFCVFHPYKNIIHSHLNVAVISIVCWSIDNWFVKTIFDDKI